MPGSPHENPRKHDCRTCRAMDARRAGLAAASSANMEYMVAGARPYAKVGTDGSRNLGISSMATRNALAALAGLFAATEGQPVRIKNRSAGVTAADRIRAGEAFDFVVLARDALRSSRRKGHLVPGSLVDVAQSPMAVAVRSGAGVSDIADEASFRKPRRGRRRLVIPGQRRAFRSCLPNGVLSERLADRLTVAMACPSRN